MNKKIKIVTSEKKYHIEIQYNNLKRKLLNLINNDKNKKIIIIDSKVNYLIKNLKFTNNTFIIKIKSSEKIKNFQNYESLTKKILLNGVDRNSTLIAIGGGVIGDLSGFIASTILRGIKFILIPTTLLAQVDSSIGGKNGINTIHGKNLVGTFYQPDLVFIDPSVLKTLSKRELKSGYAEIVKHALINDSLFFSWLENNYKKIFKLEKEFLIKSIFKSIKIKSIYVKKDSKEKLKNKNSRAILNFGHTFGHAIESFYNYGNKISHGEAISIGMIIAAKLSSKLSTLKIRDFNRIVGHFSKVGLPISDKNSKNKKIISIIEKDKKNNNGKINLILLKRIGQADFYKNVNPKYISKI